MKANGFFAFLGGVAAGVLAGILLAPDKGSNTRQKIVDLLEKKGLIISKDELDAFVAKVKSKLHCGYTDEDVESAVNDVISEDKEA